MPKHTKKTVEKLSEKENDVIIDSSSDEEEDTPLITPPVKVKKERTEKQKQATIKLMEANKLRREAKREAKKVAPVIQAPIIQEPIIQEPIQANDEDKPMTAKQLKAYMESLKPVKKPRKPYTRRAKVEPVEIVQASAPPQQPFTPRPNRHVDDKPKMMFV